MRLRVIPIVIGGLGMVFKDLVKGIRGNENQKNNQKHPKYNTVEIGLNTEKFPEDQKRLVVTQTPAKDHQLMRA